MSIDCKRYLTVTKFFRAAACAALLSVSFGHALAQSTIPEPSTGIGNGSVATSQIQGEAASVVPMSQGSATKGIGASTDALSNPYGMEALWKGSDNIARAVLVLLAIMSAGSWYILITKLLEQSKMNRHARTVDLKFWDQPSVRTAAGALEKNSAYRFIAEAGAAATTDHGGLKSHIPMADWIPMSITAAVDRVHATTQGGLAFLATVGSTSPFVGLFGTVWGIYHALTAIGISGQASIDKVAGPVGEALIMTAIGLAVAIPAVLAYNWLARRNKAVMDEVREFADELNAVIVGSAGKAA
ncbi:biopolymer transporter ExbB [Ramlibacter tataouinensis]|uniref:Biopolymer transport protein ExbB n=2 Tax=Ramlibacter tataouinensis TaxID=94132 RepID=A0A127JUW2_9BURK|nr:biopolymer transporter ExbB [Ramlibacter tataouinensis]